MSQTVMCSHSSPNVSVRTWETLLIGVALGAIMMRCAVLQNWTHWFNKNDIQVSGVQAIKQLKWHPRGNGQDSSDDGEPPENTANSEGKNNHDSATIQEESPGELKEELRVLEVSPPAECAEHLDASSREDDSIELEDLDDLEGYIYGNAPKSNKPKVDPVEVSRFPNKMWKVSFSVDNVIQPILSIFAPEIAYQPIDHLLSGSSKSQQMIEDNRQLVKAMIHTLGRFAARRGNLDLLVKVHKFEKLQRSAIWENIKLAIEYNHPECAAYLLNSVDEEDHNRVLELCAYHNRVEVLQQAFKKWTKFVKSQTANGPLVVAAARGHLESVRLLLSRCTNVEMQIESPFVSKDYPTPLLAAASGGYTEIVLELIEAGAKTYVLEEGDGTLDPVSRAIATRNATMLACLFKCDQWVLERKPELVLDMVELALENNHADLVDVFLTDRSNKIAGYVPAPSFLEQACRDGLLEIIHTLIDHGAATEELVKSLCAKGVDEDIYNPHRARSRHKLIVALLTKYRAEGCHQSIPGSSITSRLAWLGDITGLKMLWHESFAIDFNVTDRHGSSPLFIAMFNHMRWRDRELEGQQSRWLRTIDFLMSHGAKLNMEDAKYWRAHHGGVPKALLDDLRELTRMKSRNKNSKKGRKRH